MQNGIIEFMGNKLLTVCDELSGVVYVAMKPLVIGMGLSWSRQKEKIATDTRYAHMYIPFKTEGGTQEMLSLATNHLPAFLYSINPNKVRKDLRETIIAFQNETFGVINDYWNKKQKKLQHHQIIGYKSQLSQKNKKIEFLEGQVATLKKMAEPKQATVIEYRDDELFMNDPNMHNHFLDFMCMANIATHKISSIKDKSKEFKDLHQSMTNFLLFMSRRYLKVKGLRGVEGF